MHFCTDIAGLRAWAVLLVALYHFGIAGLGSGFIGVDIFFVIPAFLMGAILERGLHDPGRRSFWVLDFLLSRAQRIWPALLAMSVLWMIWGWMRPGPGEFRAVALEGLRVIIFRSNVLSAEQADYFAAASDIRLFLHPWSLSVEWVFYMALALVALGCSRRPQRSGSFRASVALLSAASFGWMLRLRTEDATEAFFFPAPRAWEMGAGVLAFYAGRRLTPSFRVGKGLTEISGFALILLPAAAGKRIDVPAHHGCQPISDVFDRKGRAACADFMDAAEARLRAIPARVPLVIISRLSYAIEGENADGQRRRVPDVWVGPPLTPFRMASASAWQARCAIWKRQRSAACRLSPPHTPSPRPRRAAGGRLAPWRAGRFLYRDGATLLAPIFNKVFAAP